MVNGIEAIKHDNPVAAPGLPTGGQALRNAAPHFAEPPTPYTLAVQAKSFALEPMRQIFANIVHVSQLRFTTHRVTSQAAAVTTAQRPQ